MNDPTSRMTIAAALLLSAAGMASAQQAMRFPDATETAQELIALWEESNSVCRGAARGDVRVAAACLSRSVYGAALNERDWCFGKSEDANADMAWHRCETGSLRFPPFEMPEIADQVR
jgi:hypothetical protein